MIESNTLNQPDDWDETSAPWPFTEDDIVEAEEDILIPDADADY